MGFSPPSRPLIPRCDQTGNLAFVGADLCVRPGLRAHTQVRPYRSDILTSMSATWYQTLGFKCSSTLKMALMSSSPQPLAQPNR
jgi:hypothetical protein